MYTTKPLIMVMLFLFKTIFEFSVQSDQFILNWEEGGKEKK